MFKSMIMLNFNRARNPTYTCVKSTSGVLQHYDEVKHKKPKGKSIDKSIIS